MLSNVSSISDICQGTNWLHLLFILCGLYYGAVCILDYITLNGRMVGMNDGSENYVKESRIGLTEYPRICPEEPRKTTVNLSLHPSQHLN